VTIQIQSNGVVLKSINPNSQLLLDGISNIPSTSFRVNPDVSRQFLMSQAQVIQNQLNACAQLKSTALNTLKTDCMDGVADLLYILRDSVSSTLNDSTEKTNALQLTKPQVLRLVDKVALQVIPNQTLYDQFGAFRIQVLPILTQWLVQNDFTIISVTQGANGSVSINRDESVTYRPQGQANSDQFTVTIQDTEGDVAVKTITLVSPPSAKGKGQ
jgi:Bacterial Ig domain